MRRGLGSPGKDEQTDGHEPRHGYEMRQPGFWYGAEAFDVAQTDLVEVRREDRRCEHARGDAEERESGHGKGPAAGLLKNNRVGGELEEEDAVDKGHVEGQEEEDRLAEEHEPRPGEAPAKACGPFLPGLLGRLVPFALGRIRLRHDGHQQDEEDAAYDEHEPKVPSPPDVLGEEAADKRSDDGPAKAGRREQGEWHRALFRDPEISERSSRVGDAGRAEQSIKEAKDE